jgi:predicted CxxxxCH...CXXCH cytochrome family protein
MNGRVDLGNGNGTCGACHGVGSSPWPTTGAHPSHQSPSISNPVACASCHVVPTTVLSPGHLDGPVRVAFSGLALARSSSPAWDGAGCSGVACHGANLPGSPAVLVPQWLDTSGAAAACGACHGIPPTQHTPSTSCGQSNCHGAEITEDSTGALSISPEGLPLHINGVIDVAQ